MVVCTTSAQIHEFYKCFKHGFLQCGLPFFSPRGVARILLQWGEARACGARVLFRSSWWQSHPHESTPSAKTNMAKVFFATACHSRSNQCINMRNRPIVLTKLAQLSHRRETALQGGLVMAKSGRLKLADNIFEHCRSIFNHWRIWPAKQSNSVKKRKIRAIMPFESPYASSYSY